MTSNTERIIEPLAGTYNLSDYEEVRNNFTWDNIDSKLNIAYETIDRHVDNGYGKKTALHYVNGDERISYTFQEVKEKTDHYARILKKWR